MWRRGIAALLLLFCAGAASAQDRLEAPTIAGPLRAVCGPYEPRPDGIASATYRLAGRPLPSLAHGCEQGARPGFALRGTWDSPRATTLWLAVPAGEGARHQWLLNVSPDRAPVLVELDKSFPVSGRQLSTNRFQLIEHGRGSGGAAWDCQYDIDFAARTLSWRVTRSTDPGIGDWICGAELRDVD